MSFFFGVDTIHGVRKTTCNALIIRLKLIHRFPHLYGCGHIEGCSGLCPITITAIYFRIFMDAATLKVLAGTGKDGKSVLFPHLYGCGHIEGRRKSHDEPERFRYFRIFMDAATLKAGSSGAFVSDWQPISASLWMRPH